MLIFMQKFTKSVYKWLNGNKWYIIQNFILFLVYLTLWVGPGGAIVITSNRLSLSVSFSHFNVLRNGSNINILNASQICKILKFVT